MRDALKQAGVKPNEIQYVEAHGTGTYVGDPIEVNALGQVLGEERQKDNPLIMGSIKANIGHTESAAGAAGLIKVLLMLGQKKIPKQIGFHSCNPQIKLEDIPALVPVETMEWDRIVEQGVVEIGRQHHGRCKDRPGETPPPGLVASRFGKIVLKAIFKHSQKH